MYAVFIDREGRIVLTDGISEAELLKHEERDTKSKRLFIFMIFSHMFDKPLKSAIRVSCS